MTFVTYYINLENAAPEKLDSIIIKQNTVQAGCQEAIKLQAIFPRH